METFKEETLIRLIKSRLDPDDFVDILGISTEMLVEQFYEKLIEELYKFNFLLADGDCLDYES